MMSPGKVVQGHNTQVTGGLPGSIRHLLPGLLKKPVLSQTPLEASVSSTVIGDNHGTCSEGGLNIV